MESAIFSLAVVGNVCNFAYNVPFVWVVVKHWSGNNISGKFLYLRIVSSIIWILYAIFTVEFFVGLSYSITFVSSSIILYVKLSEKKEIEEIEEIEPSVLVQTEV